MKAICRTALIAVQPSAVRTKGNEKAERSIGIIPHDEDGKFFKLTLFVVRGILAVIQMFVKRHQGSGETHPLRRGGTDSIERELSIGRQLLSPR